MYIIKVYIRILGKKVEKKGFWHFGQVLMDNHNLVTISILFFKDMKKMQFFVFLYFFCFEKYAWKNFRIWPYAMKYFFFENALIFFWNILVKTRYFNTEFVFYNVNIQLDIMQNLVEKYLSKPQIFTWIFFWIFLKFIYLLFILLLFFYF